MNEENKQRETNVSYPTLDALTISNIQNISSMPVRIDTSPKIDIERKPDMFNSSLISFNKIHFLLVDHPSDETMEALVSLLQSTHCDTLVRLTDPTNYNKMPLERAGITVHELQYLDASHPPDEIVNAWLQIVKKKMYPKNVQNMKNTIAIHCMSGLGRSAVLISVALIELGCSPSEAVALIREHRPNAINKGQMRYLMSYKKAHYSNKTKTCTIA